jgi:glycerate kinase
VKVIVAFDSFKGCLTAVEACETAREAILSVRPGTEVVAMPMSDGGEGMVEALHHLPHVGRVCARVHDPLMRECEAEYLVGNDATAYMEVAAACGLTLVEQEKRNPVTASSRGVGEMLLDAAARGCRRIVVGLGGSATCDGGRGIVEVLEESGYDFSSPALQIDVACDVRNPLYGENGAAYVFAPQKGATEQQVVLLDRRLRDFALETERRGLATPSDADLPGAGAAGGLGYALMTYMAAKMHSGIEMMLELLHFDEALDGADMVFTGEGRSDRQTLMGKVAHGVLLTSGRKGVPVHLVSGAIEDAALLSGAGFSSVRSINEGDHRPLSVLMQREIAKEHLRDVIIDFFWKFE